MAFPFLFSIPLNVYQHSISELIVVGVLEDYGPTKYSTCDWCNKPQSEWTNTMKWWGQGKFYCSMECYSAGEYKLNRYLCTIPTIILGLFCAFVISIFLTDLTTETIVAIVTIIMVYLLFSSASLTCVVLGWKMRVHRSLHGRKGLKETEAPNK